MKKSLREADHAIATVEPELLAGQAQAETAAELADGRAADGQAVDVAVALRAALRVLGRT